MKKYLILNADDFGVSASHNEAIMELLSQGLISSTTLIPVAGAFDQAAAWAKAHPQFPVGLHLTLTSEWSDPIWRWKPLTGAASLLDAEGYFPHTSHEVEQNANEEDVARELAAQFARMEEVGAPIFHVDNHMGSVYGTQTGRSFMPCVLPLCAKRGLGFRLPRYSYAEMPGQSMPQQLLEMMNPIIKAADEMGLFIPDELLHHAFDIVHNETYEDFRAMMIKKMAALVPNVIYETYIHPAKDTKELRTITEMWQKRVWEYDLMRDDVMHKALKDFGVELINYKQAAALRKTWR